MSLAEAASGRIPEKKWSEPEQWVWDEIRAGRIADFNEREGRKKTPLEPTTPDGWGEGRKLGSDFLKQILLRKPYRDEIPVEGVRIAGAWLPEPVDLSSGRLDWQLWLDRCRFEGAVDPTGLRIDGGFSLEGSALASPDGAAMTLNLNGADIEGYVNLSGATFKAVDLTTAKVGGQLSLDGATLDGKLTMGGLAVEQNLFMSKGAKFKKDGDLTGAKVGRGLTLEGATLDGKLTMNGLAVSGGLTLEGATLDGKLTMNGLAVGQTLFMKDAKLKDVDLTGAKVGSALSLNGATLDGKLTMNGLAVGQTLFMEGAKLKDVDLTTAKVSDQLSLKGATIDGELTMNGLAVGHHLFMGEGARFKNVDLIGARVAGQLDLEGATLEGTSVMDTLAVEQHVFVRGAKFKGAVRLPFVNVRGNLDLSDSDLTELDLSGTQIEGELRLGSAQHPRTRWRESSTSAGAKALVSGAAVTGIALNLRNVHASALQDRRDRVTGRRPWWRRLFGGREQREDAWLQEPQRLQLDGFTYDRLGGSGGTASVGTKDTIDADMHARDIHWYIEWLARDHSYSPQPYEQLAATFRAAGEPIKANRILYESRKRARMEAWRQGHYFRWLGSSLLKWTIGYGLGGRYFFALGWVVVFTLIGAGVLYFSSGQPSDYFSGLPSDGLPPGLPERLIYSLDQLLPIVEFEKFGNVKLEGWIAYYFYVQKLVGWALGSFLVAGLAGLTQK